MNHVNEIMIKDPIMCTHDTRIAQIKYLMQKYNYSEIFVIDSDENKKPIGIIHEDDLEAKTVEECDLPSDIKAEECMKSIPAVVNEFSTVDECLKIMDMNHMDRIPVIDGSCHCIGLVDKHEVLRKVPHTW